MNRQKLQKNTQNNEQTATFVTLLDRPTICSILSYFRQINDDDDDDDNDGPFQKHVWRVNSWRW